MEFPSTPPPVAGRLRRRVLILASAVAFVFYAVLLAWHMGAVPGGSDSSGYFNHARLLESGASHAVERELPGLPAARAPDGLYVPLGFKVAPDGRGMVPVYPTGFPLLILAAKAFVGWKHSADVVLEIHAMLGLLLVGALARSLSLSPLWALVSMVIVAASPLFQFFSVQAMSDMPAMVWTTAAVLAAWKARDRPAWAFAAGAALALAILIRPTDILVVPAVAIALGLPTGPGSAGIRRWSLLLLGGLPGAVFFCLHSHAAYGSYLATGYGDVGNGFAPKWIGPSLANYWRWLPVLFTPVVFLFGALPWVARSVPRAAGVLAAWLLAFMAFYSLYSCTHETWWYLRFLLPAVPALVIGGLLGLRVALPKAASMLPWGAGFALALCLVIGMGMHWSRRLYALNISRNELVYPHTAQWLQSHVPADSLILCMQVGGALYFDTDFTLLRWDTIDARSRASVEAAIAATHRPLYAALSPFEVDSALKEHLPANWTQVGKADDVRIWRRDP